MSVDWLGALSLFDELLICSLGYFFNTFDLAVVGALLCKVSLNSDLTSFLLGFDVSIDTRPLLFYYYFATTLGKLLLIIIGGYSLRLSRKLSESYDVVGPVTIFLCLSLFILVRTSLA